MKIALLGYGRMGQAIEKIAIDRGHTIVAKIDKDNPDEAYEADVAINFSVPMAAYENITSAIDKKIPVVCGTTGWLDRLDEVETLCQQNEGAFLYASNFSLGVNLFFELNVKLADMMQKQPLYTASIEEIHHTQKLDKPSGTAITLAEGIPSAGNVWHLVEDNGEGVPITSIRKDEVPGTHTVTHRSEIDEISITHTAHNRTGFALGAIIAAEWIKNKKGIFSMRDVLQL
ncbi:MAG: 4-hydroxy-tetrahydrodipicolinate reductase [Flavobacteriaceae bacterium]|nr:4-hydroxy-tetrahydrodipicolinate reductase [Flavobacteriaceae bacterium]|tara:strand:- start:247 stop:936 length:690 start_codon:yes stop_codon:yes gene_type:complete